jgi:hypothetical protein
MPRYFALTVGVLLSALLVAATGACGESSETDVIIIEPEQGSTVQGPDVTVSVETKKFDVVDRIGEEPRDGEGHIHYYIDVGEIPTVDGEPAVTDEGTYHAEATTEFTWEDVEPGDHTFAVQLVNNDHTPLSPPVIAQVTVEVEEAAGGPAPTRTPTRPAATPEETPEETPQETPEETPTEAATPTERSTPTSTP